MAALCTLSNKKGLIDNISVARNEKVGVYGFVFFRGRYIGFIIYYHIFFLLEIILREACRRRMAAIYRG